MIIIDNICLPCIPKVIQVQGPDHGSPELHVLDVLRLVPDHVHIVEGDPLVLLVGVGPHGPRRVVHHAPALAPHQGADLVVSQETLGAGELARSAATDSRGIQTLEIKIIALSIYFTKLCTAHSPLSPADVSRVKDWPYMGMPSTSLPGLSPRDSQ